MNMMVNLKDAKIVFFLINHFIEVLVEKLKNVNEHNLVKNNSEVRFQKCSALVISN